MSTARDDYPALSAATEMFYDRAIGVQSESALDEIDGLRAEVDRLRTENSELAAFKIEAARVARKVFDRNCREGGPLVATDAELRRLVDAVVYGVRREVG